MEADIYQVPKPVTEYESIASNPVFEKEDYKSPNSNHVSPSNSTKFPYDRHVYNKPSIASNPVSEEDAIYMSPNSNPVSPSNSIKLRYDRDGYYDTPSQLNKMQAKVPLYSRPNKHGKSSTSSKRQGTAASSYQPTTVDCVEEVYMNPRSRPVHPTPPSRPAVQPKTPNRPVSLPHKKHEGNIYNKLQTPTKVNKVQAKVAVYNSSTHHHDSTTTTKNSTTIPKLTNQNVVIKKPTNQDAAVPKSTNYSATSQKPINQNAQKEKPAIPKQPKTQNSAIPKITNQNTVSPKPSNYRAPIPKPVEQNAATKSTNENSAAKKAANQNEANEKAVKQNDIAANQEEGVSADVAIYMIPATPCNPDTFEYNLAHEEEDDDEEDIYVEAEDASGNSKTSSIFIEDIDDEEDNYIEFCINIEPPAAESSSSDVKGKVKRKTKRKASLSPLKSMKQSTARKVSAPLPSSTAELGGKHSTSKFGQVLRQFQVDSKKEEQEYKTKKTKENKKKEDKKKEDKKTMGNSISKGRSLWKDKEQAQRVGPEHIHVLHPTSGGVRNYHPKPSTLHPTTASPSSSTLSSAQPSPTMPRVPPPQPPCSTTAPSSVDVNGMRPLPPTPLDPSEEDQHQDRSEIKSNSLPPCPPPPIPGTPEKKEDQQEDLTEESVYLMPEIRVASSVPAERKALPEMFGSGSGNSTPLFSSPRASPGSSRHGSGKSAMSNFSDLSTTTSSEDTPEQSKGGGAERKTARPPTMQRPVKETFVKKITPHRSEGKNAAFRKVQRAKTQHEQQLQNHHIDKPSRPAAPLTSQQRSMTSSSIQRTSQSSQLSRNRSFPAAVKPMKTSDFLTPKSPAPKKPTFKPIPPPPPAIKSSRSTSNPPVSSYRTSPKHPSPKKDLTPPPPSAPAIEDNEYEMPSSRAPPRRPPPPSESSIKRAILLREARKEKKNYLQRKGEERVKSPIRKHQSFYQVRPNLLQQLEEQNAVEDETYQSIEPLKSEPYIENGDPAAINPNHRFSTNLISKTSKTTKNIKSSLVAKAGKIKKKYLSPRKSPTLDGAQEQVQPASPPQQPVDTGGVYDDAFDDSIYSGIDDVTIGEYGEIEDVGNQQFTAEEGIYLTADM